MCCVNYGTVQIFKNCSNKSKFDSGGKYEETEDGSSVILRNVG
jgi:hypothetical protein